MTDACTIRANACSARVEDLQRITPTSVGVCTTPLACPEDEFCPRHYYLKQICRYQGCHAPRRYDRDESTFTCSSKEHMDEEKRITATYSKMNYHEKRKYFTRLGSKSRCDEAQLPYTNITAPDPRPLNIVEVIAQASRTGGIATAISESNQALPGITPTKTKVLHISKKTTHSQHLVVSCCGMIHARMTNYGAEALSAVKVFILYF